MKSQVHQLYTQTEVAQTTESSIVLINLKCAIPLAHNI